MDRKQFALFGISFLVSYAILFILGEFKFFGLPKWSFPTYYLMPLLGFVLMYFGVDWASKEFESDFVKSTGFIILFTFFSLLAFYFMLIFFYIGQAIFAHPPIDFKVCFLDCSQNGAVFGELINKTINGKTVQVTVLNVNYFKNLLNNSFVYFMLASILGLISKKATSFFK